MFLFLDVETQLTKGAESGDSIFERSFLELFLLHFFHQCFQSSGFLIDEDCWIS